MKLILPRRMKNKKEYNQKYYINNKKKLSLKMKIYYDKKKEKISAYFKAYYKANHEKILKKGREKYKDYYKANHEKILKKAREKYAYKKNNNELFPRKAKKE